MQSIVTCLGLRSSYYVGLKHKSSQVYAVVRTSIETRLLPKSPVNIIGNRVYSKLIEEGVWAVKER